MLLQVWTHLPHKMIRLSVLIPGVHLYQSRLGSTIVKTSDRTPGWLADSCLGRCPGARSHRGLCKAVGTWWHEDTCSHGRQKRALMIANKADGERDQGFFTREVTRRKLSILGIVPLDENVLEADRRGLAPLDLHGSSLGMVAIDRVRARLIGFLAQRQVDTSLLP
jgi:hypothetical protein